MTAESPDISDANSLLVPLEPSPVQLAEVVALRSAPVRVLPPCQMDEGAELDLTALGFLALIAKVQRQRREPQFESAARRPRWA